MERSRFRSTYILLVLLVVLLGTVLFYASEGADQRRKTNRVEKLVMTESQIEDLTKITLQRAGTELVTLQLSDEKQWLIEESLVDQDEFVQLEASLQLLPLGEVVSKNPANWSKYGVDEASAAVITLYEGEEQIAQYFFGRPGSRSQSLHLRRNDDEKVYVVETDLSRFVSYDVNRWIDKRLFPVVKDDIESISVRIAEERWSYAYQAEQWGQVSDSGTKSLADQSAFQSYLDDLLNVKATALESDLSLFEEADNAVAVVLNDGTEIVVSIDNKDDEGIYAQVSAKEVLFRLSSDLSERLRPSFLESEDQDETEEE